MAVAEQSTGHESCYARGEKVGAEITELCGCLYAATYRLLVLIRQFDEEKLWGLPGLCSCAHWLNFKCGIGMNAAREKVRVANALPKLQKISEAFSKGELSYSKVRAMTRVANEDNEDFLMMIARHGSAHHVESMVAKYRRAVRHHPRSAGRVRRQHATKDRSSARWEPIRERNRRRRDTTAQRRSGKIRP